MAPERRPLASGSRLAEPRFVRHSSASGLFPSDMTRRAQSPSMEELLEHGDWVWRLARSLVRSDHDADDIVQETWVAALRRPPHPGASHASRSAWLTTVVRHAATRLHRSKDRRDRKELEAARADESPAADRLHERESAR